MRPWRKVYGQPGLMSSDGLAGVSDSAFALYTLLLLAQDDAGCYPWTPAKIRNLGSCRGWTGTKAAALLKELVTAKLVESWGEVLHVMEGEIKNGRPRDARTDFYYDETLECLSRRRVSDASPARQRRGIDSGTDAADRVLACADARPLEGEGEKESVGVARAREAFRETFGMADDQPSRLADKNAFWDEYTVVSRNRPGRRSEADAAYDLNVPPGSEERVLANLRNYAASDEVAKRGRIMTAAHFLEVWTQWPEVRHDQPQAARNGAAPKSGQAFVDYLALEEAKQ